MALSAEDSAQLTNDQIAAILTEPLQAKSVFLAAGPVIIDTDGSPVRIPGIDTVYDELAWYGENEQIEDVTPADLETELLPSTMKSVKVITRYSNELARQSVVQLDTVLQNRLVADVAAKVDAQFLGDSGDGVTTPRGIFAYDGTQSVTVAGDLTLDAVLEAQGLAMAANANTEAMRLVLNPAQYMALREAKDGTDRYMLEPDATAGAVGSVLGVPVVVSPHVPAGSAALADFSQIVVARDLAPSVTVLTERYADFDQQAIRVVARYDAKPMNAEAIVTLDGIGTEA